MKRSLFVLAVLLVLFSGCSSSPKRAMLVTDVSDSASVIYENANAELIGGNIQNAGAHLQQAYNLALSVDDTDLLCRISLSAIIYRLTNSDDGMSASELNPVLQLAKKTDSDEDFDVSDTPFYGLSAQDLLEMAKKYASRSTKKEVLGAVCPIYDLKIQLAKKNPLINFNEKLNELNASEKKLSSEAYYLAFLKRTQGDLYAFNKDYNRATDAYLEAAKIHLKNRYVSEIGLDYYSAARMASLSNNKNLAVEYIQTALKYDRDAENTSAIASDYNAYGLILLKGTPSDSDKKLARDLISWASDIYRAGGFEKEARACRMRAESIK
ncbi:MAG: hypothetical protein IJJ70_02720 [Treponema sp.]|nr:hypothetical protein [Treponema sp.]